jgi:hypothetical protein
MDRFDVFDDEFRRRLSELRFADDVLLDFMEEVWFRELETRGRPPLLNRLCANVLLLTAIRQRDPAINSALLKRFMAVS